MPRRSYPARKRPRLFRPRLESLEDRHLLAASINIVEGEAGTGDQDANLLADGQILFADPDIGGNTLSTGALRALDTSMDIVVQSRGTILLDGGLALNTVAGYTITLSTNTPGGGSISLGNLQTSGAGVTIDAATDLICGNLTTFTDGIVLRAGNQMTVEGLDTFGTITASANQDGIGSEGFIQGFGYIRSRSDSDSAVTITVNTPTGGTGNATLRDIGWGNGSVIVDTYAGGILSGQLIEPGDSNVKAVQATMRPLLRAAFTLPSAMSMATAMKTSSPALAVVADRKSGLSMVWTDRGWPPFLLSIAASPAACG